MKKDNADYFAIVGLSLAFVVLTAWAVAAVLWAAVLSQRAVGVLLG